MSRFIVICLWIMAAALTVYPGWAAPRSGEPPAAPPVLGNPSPAQPGDMPEAKAASEKAEALFKAGKYEEARYLAEQALWSREKALGPEHALTAASLTQVANIYSGLRNMDKGGWTARRDISFYQRALAIREKALGPEAPETAASLANLAAAYLWQGNYAQGFTLAQKSLKIREKVFGPDHPETAASLNLLAGYYGQTGSLDQALPLAQRALTIREKVLGPEHRDTAESLQTLALLYKQTGSVDQALSLAQRSLTIREKTLGPEHPDTAESLRILGLVYLDFKDYRQAESYLGRVQTPSGKKDLAQVYLATGRNDAALTLLVSAAPTNWSTPQYKAQYYSQKGQALRSLGQREGAYTAFLEAIDTIEELRARTPGKRTSFFAAGQTVSYSLVYRAMVGLLAEMAQKGESIPPALQRFGGEPVAAAFYLAEASKARALLEAMAAGASQTLSRQIPSDLAAREKNLQERLEALEANRAPAFQDVVDRNTYLSSRDSQSQDLFQLKSQALLKEQQGLAAELRRRDPRYAALRYPQPLKAPELPLKPGEVLLEYALGEKESYVFRVESGGKTQIFRLALGQEALEKRLGALLAPFRQSTMRREDLSRFSLTEAAGFYRELLEPALSGIAPGTRLIIVPDGVLGAFPFEALVVQSGPDWGKSVLVGDRWLVTYSQSASILALNRILGASKAPQPLFALGDCIYEKESPRYQAYKAHQGQAGELGHAGSEKALTMSVTGARGGQLKFPPLPETRKTVEELASLFGVPARAPQVLLDVQATETRVRQSPLGQYRYLFFGTHGFLADNLSVVQEPVLVLTLVENTPPDNGFLTFSKVLQLKLDADVVTLAACMTGVGQVTQGEGVLNFARAFQQAGARSVMVTLWNIPVEESLKFYRTFYQGLKEGKTRLQALQAARKSVRDKEPHPYFWSGIILHGEG